MLALDGKKIDSIYLDEFAMILRSYQRILDRAYLAYQGKSRAGYVPRARFHASMRSLDKGSILMELLVYAPALAQALLVATNPNDLQHPLSHLKSVVLDFYRKVANVRQKINKEPIVIVGDNNDVGDVYVGDITAQGNVEINVNKIVQYGADMMRDPMHDITRRIKKGAIDELRSYSHSVQGEKKGYTLTEADAGIMDSHSSFGDPEEMAVNIVQFNKYTGNGRLEVVESNTIDSRREIGFYADSDKVEFDKIAGALRQSVRWVSISAIKEFYCYPSGERKISRLIIDTFG